MPRRSAGDRLVAMRFETTLSQFGINTGIEVPPEVIEQLGGGKRPAVSVVVNGFAFSSTLGVMGGRFLIPSARRSGRRRVSPVVTRSLSTSTSIPRRARSLFPDDLAAALDAAC